MPCEPSRRMVLRGLGAVALAGPPLAKTVARARAASTQPAADGGPRARVIVAREDILTRSPAAEHPQLLVKLVNAAMQRLTGRTDAAAAWRQVFSPADRVGIKVNTLGLTTQPVVVDAIVAGLRGAGVPADHIIIWDRFDVELGRAGFRLSGSPGAVRCRGTDAEHYGSGYEEEVRTSGRIGSCFSRILTEQVDALISVPVMKDHNLAGVSLGLKNFFGAIHNPNKYHGQNCDPYVADVAAHPVVRRPWRLTICDATTAQCHGGPTRSDEHAWRCGGLIVGTDGVAVDAVAADFIERERARRGLRSLSDERRPARHIVTAAARGLGTADLARIEQVEL